MSLDLELDDAQCAIASSVGQFCADHCADEKLRALGENFPHTLWRELAELGVLALGSEEGGGGALEVAAAMEALGRAAFPGPLIATFFANRVLSAKLRSMIQSGETLVALGTAPLLPWAPLADCFIELEGGRAWLCEPRGSIEPIATLAAEPWGRTALERGEELRGVEAALDLMEVARAAYLAAAGGALIDLASAHASTRVQFGRPIGEFQAVAHPLAACHVRLSAAANLSRFAAARLDAADPDARASVAAARLAAKRAAVETAYVVHQSFGALGVTLEGPVFRISRQVRQLASTPPGEERAREVLLATLGL